MAGEGHLGECGEETAVGAVVIGEQLALAVELLDYVKESKQFSGLGCVWGCAGSEVIALREHGAAEAVAALSEIDEDECAFGLELGCKCFPYISYRSEAGEDDGERRDDGTGFAVLAPTHLHG